MFDVELGDRAHDAMRAENFGTTGQRRAVIADRAIYRRVGLNGWLINYGSDGMASSMVWVG